MGYCATATEVFKDKLPPKVFVIIRFCAHYVIPTIATIVYGGFKLKKTWKMIKSANADSADASDSDAHVEEKSKSPFIFTELIQAIKKATQNHDEAIDQSVTNDCTSSTEEEDGDRLFLMAILGEMKKVPDEYKLDLKTDLMLAVRNWRRVDKLSSQGSAPNPLLAYEKSYSGAIPNLYNNSYQYWPTNGQFIMNKDFATTLGSKELLKEQEITFGGDSSSYD